jgi:hypothetical protein
MSDTHVPLASTVSAEKVGGGCGHWNSDMLSIHLFRADAYISHVFELLL